MRFLTIKSKWNLFLVNHIYAGTWAFKRKRKLLRAIGWKIGENTRIVGPVDCTGIVEIGNDCWIGKLFRVHGNGNVKIGDRCDIAPEVSFFTGGHQLGGPDRRAGKGENYTICVESGCWLGGRVLVANSVRIGTGCVVAAGACVVQDLPEHSLAAGVPARVKRSLDLESK